MLALSISVVVVFCVVFSILCIFLDIPIPDSVVSVFPPLLWMTRGFWASLTSQGVVSVTIAFKLICDDDASAGGSALLTTCYSIDVAMLYVD